MAHALRQFVGRITCATAMTSSGHDGAAQAARQGQRAAREQQVRRRARPWRGWRLGLGGRRGGAHAVKVWWRLEAASLLLRLACLASWPVFCRAFGPVVWHADQTGQVRLASVRDSDAAERLQREGQGLVTFASVAAAYRAADDDSSSSRPATLLSPDAAAGIGIDDVRRPPVHGPAAVAFGRLTVAPVPVMHEPGHSWRTSTRTCSSC